MLQGNQWIDTAWCVWRINFLVAQIVFAAMLSAQRLSRLVSARRRMMQSYRWGQASVCGAGH